ncbi:protein tas-like isoform X2 [Gossypium australe]|uniref:Protein tas-like isoform X2 n=1 Tax=Gossypium australe TaxID=47621 RepID=A0A5B6W1H2_9ROSI|nr:protein tas-like isoform X2 [Gossypium australe]
MSVPLFNLAPNLTVSRLCLGTMTFGEQNSLPQSLRLLDQAFDAGINFFDSAEMYPVPQRAETQGKSEEYFGQWVRKRKISRDRVVIATKVAGPSGQMSWIRDGPKCLDAKNITEAVDGSLKRLQMDHIDLYQIHWPDRFVYSSYPLFISLGDSLGLWTCHFKTKSCHFKVLHSCVSSYVPMFGETEYDPVRQFSSVPIEEQLDALGRAVDAGKIRYIGLSNETPYGVMKFLHFAENNVRYPKIISVQNSYSLLCRTFDSGMAECCHHERIYLLGYSPLAMGILSGKYFASDGAPSDARLNLFKGRYSEGESRYSLARNTLKLATMEYLGIAEKYGLHPVSLAIAFVLNHPLVASTVFGVTKSWQLEEVISACNVELTSEIIADINKVHAKFPNPCSEIR